MAINSQGSRILHVGLGSPGDYQALEQVTSIGGPNGTLSLIDVSHLGSTRKEYLPGLADNGQISLTCNFTAGEKQMQMFDLFNSSADPTAFRIEIPSTSARTNYHRFSFLAIVMKWALTDGVDKKVDLSIDIQTTGGLTYSFA